MAQFTTAEKVAYANAMADLRASGARVNLTDYDGGPVVEIPDEDGEVFGGIGSLPGWEHEDPTLLAFRSGTDAESYLKAVFVDRHISGYYCRWEARFLASRGFDPQGRRLAA